MFAALTGAVPRPGGQSLGPPRTRGRRLSRTSPNEGRLEPRIEELIRTLGLRPHPEGGHYQEIWRSPVAVAPDDGRGHRAALTVIYFLLPAGAVSRWHRVRSDEVWHYCEGAPLELLRIPPDDWRLDRARLGPAPANTPVHWVPADWWQAARSLGGYTLVSCTVAPGFEFSDFTMLADQPQLVRELSQALPEAVPFV